MTTSIIESAGGISKCSNVFYLITNKRQREEKSMIWRGRDLRRRGRGMRRLGIGWALKWGRQYNRNGFYWLERDDSSELGQTGLWMTKNVCLTIIVFKNGFYFIYITQIQNILLNILTVLLSYNTTFITVLHFFIWFRIAKTHWFYLALKQ